MNKLLFLFMFLCYFSALFAQDDTNNLSFNTDDVIYGAGSNSNILSSVSGSDGKILIEESLITYNKIPRNSIARLKSTGKFKGRNLFDPGHRCGEIQGRRGAGKYEVIYSNNSRNQYSIS